MAWLKELFKVDKPIIGVVHLKPLPGSPMYEGGFEEVVEEALRDARALVEGGVDGILVENYGDRPFRAGRVGAETVAAMSSVVVEVAKAVDVPVGVNVLRSDGPAAMAIAAVSRAKFIRVNVYVGAVATEQGVISGCADEVVMVRRRLRANVKVMADVGVKHARQLAYLSLGEEALDAVERGMADALIVTGPRTGVPPSIERIAEVKQAAPLTPVFIGSGISLANVEGLLKVGDGGIVGTYFRRGSLEAPVDQEKVSELMRAVSKLRARRLN
ncbi:MAG: BtpA/SgcQ family protein [Candidatus Nezhaarchaeota archaeon]|nr:BtpA/SgcQ family protein [Candidatus Nezhaarchaeota archaeon]